MPCVPLSRGTRRDNLNDDLWQTAVRRGRAPLHWGELYVQLAFSSPCSCLLFINAYSWCLLFCGHSMETHCWSEKLTLQSNPGGRGHVTMKLRVGQINREIDSTEKQVNFQTWNRCSRADITIFQRSPGRYDGLQPTEPTGRSSLFLLLITLQTKHRGKIICANTLIWVIILPDWQVFQQYIVHLQIILHRFLLLQIFIQILQLKAEGTWDHYCATYCNKARWVLLLFLFCAIIWTSKGYY